MAERRVPIRGSWPLPDMPHPWVTRVMTTWCRLSCPAWDSSRVRAGPRAGSGQWTQQSDLLRVGSGHSGQTRSGRAVGTAARPAPGGQ